MFQFLTQPYPRDRHSLRRWLLTSVGAGLFVAVFLNIFQPFGSQQWNHPHKALILTGYGVVTFVCLAIVGTLFTALFGKLFGEHQWTVGLEILWNVILITIIAFGNVLYSDWITGQGNGNILIWLGVTAAIGVIPATVITLLNYNRLLRKYTTGNLSVRPSSLPQVPSPEILTFTAENEKDAVTVSLDQLLFIESADNYSEIVYLQEGNVKKELLRGSLSRFETQAHHPGVVRCHRSFVVNLHQVERISGNAQGYRLHLPNTTLPVPVARRYSDLVAKYFKK